MKDLFYIFLDVDGVLNGDKTQDVIEVPHGSYQTQKYIGVDPELVKELKVVYDYYAEQYKEVRIILSSTWRRRWHKGVKTMQDKFANRLDEALAAEDLEVYDKTGMSSYLDRGYLIDEYLRQNPCDDFVVIDDEIFDFYEYPEIWKRFLHTDWTTGLTSTEFMTFLYKAEEDRKEII